jgi:hypothetical protein
MEKMLDRPASLRDDFAADIYGTSAVDLSVPKLKMPAFGHRACPGTRRAVLDGNARQNLATFCQTYLPGSSAKPAGWAGA